MRIKCVILITFLAFTSISAQRIVNLRCNYEDNPLSIDSSYLRLSWNIKSKERGEYQTAYQILVASSLAQLNIDKGDVWNTGEKKSSECLYIQYGGNQLESGKKYFWKVRIWNKKGQVTSWSKPATWTMGLMHDLDWTAEWITASKWFIPPKYRAKGLELGVKGGWADIDLNQTYAIDSIKLYFLSKETRPYKYKIQFSNDFNFIHSKIQVDCSSGDLKSSTEFVRTFRVKATNTSRYVRLEIMGDSTRPKVNVRQIEIYSAGKNVALMKYTREYGTAWDHGHAPFLVDGMPSEKDGNACLSDACSSLAAPMFRKTFALHKKVKRATLRIAAMGMVDVSINGIKIGDKVLCPPFSDYYKRVIYVTYDITNKLKQGDNVFGAVLGNGFFSPPGLGFGQRHGGNGMPRFLIQAQIEFQDNSSIKIITDDTWKWATSEITFNDIWQGYFEDRNLLQPKWAQAGFDDKFWHPVSVCQAPMGKMEASIAPPIRIRSIVKPIKVENNEAYFDKVYVGWSQIKVHGQAGQKITITGEGPGFQSPPMTFLLSKDGSTVLSPRFILQPVPMKMKIEGLTFPLKKSDISVQCLGVIFQPSGSFVCSNSFLNKVYSNLVNTIDNYVYDVPADPNREKQGWTQDAQNMFNTAAYISDVRGLYSRWWKDMTDNQDEQGVIGSVVPVVNRQVYDWNSPWWSGASVFLPWEYYTYYGDRKIIEDGYLPMKKYVDFLQKMALAGDGSQWCDYPYLTNNLDKQAAKDTVLIWNGAGDWLNPYIRGQNAVPTPVTTMTAWYCYADIIAKIANLLGNKSDAETYTKMALSVKRRFNASFLNAETGLYGDNKKSQTAQVLPLAVGIVPENLRDSTYKRLKEAIGLCNNHIGTGFVATPFLLQILASHRESELSNCVVNQKDYPGWNTLMKGGVFMEEWNGNGAQMPSCGGAIGSWLYQSVLGIQPDRNNPGFKKIIIAPQPDVRSGLIFAKGYYDCVYGRIRSEWRVENHQIVLHVSIPVNTTATICIPTNQASKVQESGKSATKSIGVHLIKTNKRYVVYEIGAGDYCFKASFGS